MKRIIMTALVMLAPAVAQARDAALAPVTIDAGAAGLSSGRGPADDTGRGTAPGGASIDIANALEDALATLQYDAQALGDQAAAAGYDADAYALSNLVQDGNTLAQKVYSFVIAPLTNGVAVPIVLGRAQRLDSSFDSLSYDVSNMTSAPDLILSDIDNAVQLRDALKAELLASERDRSGRRL